MTCIVGIVSGADVLIAGDSAGVDPAYRMTVRRDQKVFRKVGEGGQVAVVGFTTSFRMGQILRYCLEIPHLAEGRDVMEWAVVELIPAMMEAFRSGRWSKTNDHAEGGDLLFGIAGRLFHICADFQVAEPDTGMAAVGCGADFALGAMFASRTAEDAVQVLLEGLDAASHFSAGVIGPFHVVRT